MNNITDQYFRLDGKTAIVTGASRGIGFEVASAFIDAGASVFGLGRTKIENLDSVPNFNYMNCDVADFANVDAVCAQIFECAKGVDILVNAAGVTAPSSGNKNQTVDVFEETLRINLVGTYKISTVIAEYMKAGNGGAIVNITSIGSFLGFPNNPGYTASKGGVQTMSKSMAFDLAEYGIRVNCLAPGYVKTDMTRLAHQNSIKYKERLERMMIKRWGEPLDVALAAIFLASDASRYITGTDLAVDGGWLAKGI